MIMVVCSKFYSKKMVFVSAFALGFVLLPHDAIAMENSNATGNKQIQQNEKNSEETVSALYETHGKSHNEVSKEQFIYEKERINIDSLKFLKEEASKGNIKAKVLHLYYNPKADPAEWPKIKKWLENQSDDAVALSWLGKFEEVEWEESDESTLQKKLKRAEEYYLRAAEKGLSSAYHNVALIYDFIHHDPVKAEEYYTLAIQKGHFLSYLHLAALYSCDLQKAEEFHLKAAEKDVPSAYTSLAFFHLEINKNQEKGLECLLEADQRGESDAWCHLADTYIYGTYDVPKNPKKGLECLLQAKEKGQQDAIRKIADFHMLNHEGFPANPQKALKYYLLSVENGDMYSNWPIGMLFCSGKDGNPQKAEAYLLKVNKSLLSTSYASLGEFYQIGANGFEKNLEKAFFYHSKCLEDPNCVRAFFFLGQLYETGWGIHPSNLERSVHYYTKHLGFKNSIEDSEKALLKLLGGDEFIEKGMEVALPRMAMEEKAEKVYKSLCFMEAKMDSKNLEYLLPPELFFVNQRNHKPASAKYYEMFGKSLTNASYIMENFKDGTFIFMTPKAAAKDYLLSHFNQYDPLNPTSADEIGIRLYRLGNEDLAAFGNQNVKLADTIIDILEGEYSIPNLIAHHQKKRDLLVKLNNQTGISLDEETRVLEECIFSQRERKYVWSDDVPKPAFTNFLVSTLQKKYNITEEKAKLYIANKRKGIATNIPIDQCLEAEINNHIKLKIEKRFKKIKILENTVNFFKNIIHSKKKMRLHDKFDFLGAIFE